MFLGLLFLVVWMLLAAVPGDEGVDVELPLAPVVVHESGKKFVKKLLIMNTVTI